MIWFLAACVLNVSSDTASKESATLDTNRLDPYGTVDAADDIAAVYTGGTVCTMAHSIGGVLWALNVDTAVSARIAAVPEILHGPTDLVHHDGWWGYTTESRAVFWQDTTVLTGVGVADGLLVDGDTWVATDSRANTFTVHASPEALAADTDGVATAESFNAARYALAGDVVYAASQAAPEVEVGTLGAAAPTTTITIDPSDEIVNGLGVLGDTIYLLRNGTLSALDMTTGALRNSWTVPDWSFGLVCE